MDPARGRPDIGRDVFKESDDIVVRPLFNLSDLVDIELPFLTNDCGIRFRNQAEARHRFASDSFNFQPDLKFAFIRPDATHFWSGITSDHRSTIKAVSKRGKSFSSGKFSGAPRREMFQPPQCLSSISACEGHTEVNKRKTLRR